jgi:hypothetical protein
MHIKFIYLNMLLSNFFKLNLILIDNTSVRNIRLIIFGRFLLMFIMVKCFFNSISAS